MSEPLRVDHENSRTWTVVAHTARVDHRIMSLIGDPQQGSSPARVDDLYPFEKVSDRVRAHLLAGIEHMLMWADLAAPLKLHEDQVMNVTLRPAYTLARATTEASAQAVWLLDTRNPVECVRRHLSLIRWDPARASLTQGKGTSSRHVMTICSAASHRCSNQTTSSLPAAIST
jgi:hypothetical protein